jgi:hypothetical protein
MTRDDEYREVRRLLDDPIEQRPSMDLIVSGLIRQEQFQTNRISNTGKAWTPETTSVTSVVDTAEYTLTPTNFGKALFCYRDLGDNVMLPVPFTDFENELDNQSYDYRLAPWQSAGLTGNIRGEKIAFYRLRTTTHDVTAEKVKMRIYPIPIEAGLVYRIVYASGPLDWSGFDWRDTPALAEWSGLRTLKVAAFLLAQSEWKGLTRAENSDKRRDLMMVLKPQIEEQNEEFRVFVKNPSGGPSIGTVDAWYVNQ